MQTLDGLEDEGRIVFRYAEDTNPNGSRRDIAGILNERGNVLGMMPHPEDLTDAAQGGIGRAAALPGPRRRLRGEGCVRRIAAFAALTVCARRLPDRADGLRRVPRRPGLRRRSPSTSPRGSAPAGSTASTRRSPTIPTRRKPALTSTRILIVPKDGAARAAGAVVEVRSAKRGTDVRLFGPLMQTGDADSIRRDVMRWTGGARDC